METNAPSDLNHLIAQWRAAAVAGGRVTSDALVELESHLQDSCETLRSSGLAADEAFLIAARRLGTSDELDRAFSRSPRTNPWRRNVGFALAGYLIFLVAGRLGSLAGMALIGSLNGLVSDPIWLGYAGAVVQLLVFGGALALSLYGLLVRPNSLEAHGESPARKKLPGIPFMVLAVAALLTMTLGPVVDALMIRSVPVSMIGAFFVVGQAGQWMMTAAVIAAGGLAIRSSVPWGKAARGVVCGLLYVGLCFWPTGCGRPPQAQAPGSPPPAMSAGARTPLEKCLVGFDPGNPADSVADFLKLDFSVEPFSAGTPLGLSETQFMALGQAGMDKMNPQLLADLETVKKLVRAVSEDGQKVAAKDGPAAAAQHTAQLRRLAARLDSPSSTRLAQLVGQAVTKKLAAGK